MRSITPVLVAASLLSLLSMQCMAANARIEAHLQHPTAAANASDRPIVVAEADDSRFIRTAGTSTLGAPFAQSRINDTTRTARAGVAEAQGSTSGWLAAFVVVSLIGYQLRRKHKFLRPQRFTL